MSDCLGIKIDNKLCWKPHITASCKKFCSKLKFIRKIKGLPSNVLEEIYYKGIIPSIIHCISVWGTCSLSLINSLEDIHIRAERTIHKLKPSVKDNEVLYKIAWSPLQYIYKRRLATIMHEVYHNKVHQKLGSLFEKEAKQRTLQNKNNFRPIIPRYETSRNCVRYRDPIIWNKLAAKWFQRGRIVRSFQTTTQESKANIRQNTVRKRSHNDRQQRFRLYLLLDFKHWLILQFRFLT